MGYNGLDRILTATSALDSYRTAQNTGRLVELAEEEMRTEKARQLGWDPRIGWAEREKQLRLDAKAGVLGAHDALVQHYRSLIFVFGGARAVQKHAPIILAWGTYRVYSRAWKEAQR